MIVLDTNVCIRILRGREDALAFFSKNRGSLVVPFMAVGELYYGAERSRDPESAHIGIDRFLSTLQVVDSNGTIMSDYGKFKAALAKEGMPVGDADTLIAAVAKSLGASVATSNVKHFERFQGLEICNIGLEA